MAKDKTIYTCNECGGTSAKWLGKCPHCNAWNTLIESVAEPSMPAKNRFASLAKTAEVATLADIEAVDMPRTPTGLDELDRVLGGELTVWGDAAQSDSGNVFTVLTPDIFAVAESWWSPRSETSGRDGSNAQPRMELHRCRVGARGVPSNTIYSFSTLGYPYGGECPYAEFAFSPLPL